MKDDMISRQAAINALGEEPLVWYDGEDELAERNQWRRDVAAIKALPSAQPERDDCDTCKHGYFGSVECNNCRVRYPSHWESREGGEDGRSD